jgi:UDP-glucose 4-epimerase
MAVLVTGGAGYIGSHMVHRLVEDDESVVVIDNLSTGFRWALPAGVPLIEGDIADMALCRDVMRRFHVEEIIHFAASTVVSESVVAPLRYYANNTCALRNLLDAACQHGVERLIFSSTAAVYGTAAQVVDEDAPVRPISPYGASKMMGERIIADANQAGGPNYVILRYFNVAGADPAGRTGQSTKAATHLIKVACQAALGQRPGLCVFGTDYPTPDGTGVRDYIHVSDLIDAHSLALDHLRRDGPSEVFNCAYGHGFSVLQVIDAVRRAAGVDFPVNHAPRRPGDPAALIARADKIKTVLGWQPRFDDLDTIVRHALAWERNLTQFEGETRHEHVLLRH